MLALILMVAFAQEPSCASESAALAAAVTRANAFDLAAAADLVDTPALRGCVRAEIATLYLRGLLAARKAYSQGGDPNSLGPVKAAIAGLEAHAGREGSAAEIARFVLLGSAAAAQSERQEMEVFLEHAVRLEALQLDAREPGAPIVTAHEVAGDLWLQVHQYEQARLSYLRAQERLGPSPRLDLGLARVAVRLKGEGRACAEYERLLERWRWPPKGPAEIDEGRAYLKKSECRAATQPRRR